MTNESIKNMIDAKKKFYSIVIGMDNFKKILESKMAERGFNTNSLSIAAGIDTSAITHIIRGRSMNPRIDTAIKIARALKCSLDDLCGYTPPETINPADNRDMWRDVVKRVDDLVKASKKNISPEVKADMYLACYEFNLIGLDIKEPKTLQTILKFIQK